MSVVGTEPPRELVLPGPVAPVAYPPSRRIALLALALGVAGDVAVRAGVVGAAGAVLVVGCSAAMIASRRLRTPTSRALVATAPLFGVWLAVRTSGWLLPLDGLAAFALLALGASLSSGGSVADLPFMGLAARVWHGSLHAVCAPGFLPFARPRRYDGDGGGAGRTLAVVRGIVLAVPVLALLGGLLASADAVFASFFDIEVDGIALLAHVTAITVCAWLALGLLRVASAEPPRALPVGAWRLGPTEVTILLASVIALFGAFTVAQVVAIAGGADHVLRTTGLTYAEYARSGFFQLLWVAGLTVVGLLGLRAAAADTGRRFTVLVELIVALTLIVVVVAFRRLALYEDAYGLTMLRLYCSITAVWIGVVLALLGASFAGLGRGRAWLAPAGLGAALAILLALNIVNPEAVVVRHNLSRSPGSVAVDAAYLRELSDDALPTIASLLPGLDAATRDAVLAELRCPAGDGHRGWAAWNLGRDRADEVRDRLCAA